MSTRSFIGILNEDKTVDYIYCHFDGYPSYMLPMLNNNYKVEEKVKELMELGDISSLRPLVSPPEGEEHTFRNSRPDTTVAYHRDRGEDLIQRRTTSEALYTRELGNVDYGYLFKNNEWIIV